MDFCSTERNSSTANPFALCAAPHIAALIILGHVPPPYLLLPECARPNLDVVKKRRSRGASYGPDQVTSTTIPAAQRDGGGAALLAADAAGAARN